MATRSALDPSIRYDDADQEGAQMRAQQRDQMMRAWMQNQQFSQNQQLQDQDMGAKERMFNAELADRGTGRQYEGGLRLNLAEMGNAPQMAGIKDSRQRWDAQRADGASGRELNSMLDTQLLNAMRGGGAPSAGNAGDSMGGGMNPMMGEILAKRAGITYMNPQERELKDITLKNRIEAARSGGAGGVGDLGDFQPQTISGKAKFNEVYQQTGDKSAATMAAQQVESKEAGLEASDYESANAGDLGRFLTADTAMSGTQKGFTEGGLGALGGAAAGAAAGSIIPGVGTLIGGLVGGGLGALGGGIHGGLTGQDDPNQEASLKLLDGIRKEAISTSRARGISGKAALDLVKLKYRNLLANSVDKIGADKTRALLTALDTIN